MQMWFLYASLKLEWLCTNFMIIHSCHNFFQVYPEEERKLGMPLSRAIILIHLINKMASAQPGRDCRNVNELWTTKCMVTKIRFLQFNIYHATNTYCKICSHTCMCSCALPRISSHPAPDSHKTCCCWFLETIFITIITQCLCMSTLLRRPTVS